MVIDDDKPRYEFIIMTKFAEGFDNQGNKQQIEKLYCPDCKEGFVTPITIDGFGAFIKTEQVSLSSTPVRDFTSKISNLKTSSSASNYEIEPIIAEYQCPTCGKKANPVDCLTIKHLSKDDVNIFLVWADVITSEEDHLVRFKWYQATYSGFNDKLQIKMQYDMVVFNTKTGQTYKMQTYYDKDNSNIKKPSKKDKGPRIYNISYSGSKLSNLDRIVPFELRQKLFETLYQKISKNLGYSPVALNTTDPNPSTLEKRIRDLDDGPYSFEDLILMNRFPNLPTYSAKKMIQHLAITKKHKYMFIDEYGVEQEAEGIKEYKHKCVTTLKNTNPDPVKHIASYFNIKVSKSVRKIIFENASKVSEFAIVERYFKEPNNVAKVINSKVFKEYRENFLTRRYLGKNSIEELNDFMELLFKTFKNETIVANKFDAAAVSSRFFGGILSDTVSLYQKITTFKSDKPIVIPSLNGNIKEIHDRFSEAYDLLIHVNHSLLGNYTEEDLKLQCETDQYILRFAQDTYELKSVGKYMHICVGGYWDRALSKELNIALLIDKSTDKPIVCIELSGDCKEVSQTKLRFNHKPTGEPREFLFNWLQENKIKFSSRMRDLPEEDPGEEELSTHERRQLERDRERELEREQDRQIEQPVTFTRIPHQPDELDNLAI